MSCALRNAKSWSSPPGSGQAQVGCSAVFRSWRRRTSCGANGGGAVRDSGAVDGAQFGEASPFVLVESDGLVGARGQVVVRHRAVQLQ